MFYTSGLINAYSDIVNSSVTSPGQYATLGLQTNNPPSTSPANTSVSGFGLGANPEGRISDQVPASSLAQWTAIANFPTYRL